MVDKVLPLKLEHPTSGGTETDEIPAEVEAGEDHIATRGVVYQAAGVANTALDELVQSYRDASGNLVFHDDVLAGSRTLSQLAASGSDELVGVSADDTTPGYLLTKIISPDASIIIVEGVPGGDERLQLTHDRKGKVSDNDSTPGHLLAKILSADSSVEITEVNDGGNENLNLRVDPANVFADKIMESAVTISTSLLTPQDAFAGVSLNVDVAGDYIALYEASSAGTNDNNEMEISLGLNSTTVSVAGSEREGKGNAKRSLVSQRRMPGLAVNDKVHGLFRKVAGSGNAQLFQRSLSILRIG